jgi:hypothetical protein
MTYSIFYFVSAFDQSGFLRGDTITATEDVEVMLGIASSKVSRLAPFATSRELEEK